MKTRHKTEVGVTFSVHDVIPGTTEFEKVRTTDCIENLVSIHDLDPYRKKKDSDRVIYCSDYNSYSLWGIRCHPLIEAVHMAFSHHLPLILSPDIIWITILQGFSQQVKLNPEKYRSLLVSHQGQIDLSVDFGKIQIESPQSSWDEAINSIEDQLHIHTRNDSSALLADFRTSSSHERLASSVVLLDLYKPYFNTIVLRCLCGIPEITLTGELADWIKLRRKLELFRGFDLEWWLITLRDICDHFIQASSGSIDLEFWRNIYKKKTAYNFSYISGWILKLFPYVRTLNADDYRTKNPLLFDDSANRLTSNQFPSGLSMVPFIVQQNQIESKMQLLGGLMAVEQISQSFAIKPRVGWAVRKMPPDIQE